MKDENYIHIAGWMIKRENLSGNELLCYALIYGFSQDGGWCDSSHQYIADWLNVSKRTVISTIQSLVDKNKIQKEVYEKSNIKFCKYRALISPVVKNFHGGSEDSSLGGGEESSPNNIYINNNKDNNNTPLTPQGGEQGSLFPNEEEKPKKSKTTISFRNELIALGVEPQLANDWIRVRQTKRATQTNTAWEHVKRNLEKIQNEYGISPNDAIRICAEQSWSGCEVRFFRNIGQEQNGYNQQQTNDPDTYEYDRNGNKVKIQDWQ